MLREFSESDWPAVLAYQRDPLAHEADIGYELAPHHWG
ncbi:hypothetical protein NKDENANG_02405 [Candidatus Entotheonellaceae bacterium PAL068K]